jgi:diacylglycerol kinase (ATP)
MKTLFIYNPSSGKGLTQRQVEYINHELSIISSSVEYRYCVDLYQLYEVLKNPLYAYDLLVFAGGDGTFHHVVNALSSHEYRPVLGIIPCGTLNDASKNFGYTRNIGHSLKIISKGFIQEVDIFKVNNHYAVFSLSVGTFSDIPYRVKAIKKKRFHVLSYYELALKSLARKDSVQGEISLDNQTPFCFFAPFLLVLNSRFMAGFKINNQAKLDDGLADLMYTSKGWFNGLFRFFFRPRKVHKFAFNEAYINMDKVCSWDIDGEELVAQKVEIKVLRNHIKIIAKTRKL